MNFDYTDDQKALKEEARRFLTAASPLTVARAVLENPGDGYDTALWGRIVEQGWCGATIPESYGGLGLGYVELCALAEELGRAVAPVPFASSIYFFAEALMLVGSEQQKSELLPLVASGELLGEASKGLETLHRIQERGAILLAFEQLGGADRCLEMARDYALERYAFGRPIGSYQAIKHKLADVFVKNEVARANAYYGAWALSTDAPELPVAAAAARVAGSAAYWMAAKEMIQTYGGIGVTWEADCHFFYRRARHLGLVIGAPRDWKRRLADSLEARVNAEKQP